MATKQIIFWHNTQRERPPNNVEVLAYYKADKDKTLGECFYIMSYQQLYYDRVGEWLNGNCRVPSPDYWMYLEAPKEV